MMLSDIVEWIEDVVIDTKETLEDLPDKVLGWLFD